MRRILPLLIALVVLSACFSLSTQETPPPQPPSEQPASVAASTTLSARTPVGTETPQRLPATATVSPSALPTVTLVRLRETCESAPVCILRGHFLFQRPIPPEGKTAIERSYPYGSTQNGQREVHHGVEFANPQGTPVLAAADGKVIFAGDDRQTQLAWVPAFYGNVIVLEHWLEGERFFTLYGHLHRILVSTEQNVHAGQPIGEVGASGTAIGSHLHFEIRRGTNDYNATRNPELWLIPLEGTGVLAGRIVDERGSLVRGTVNVQRVENGILNPLSVGAASTYAPGNVNSDDNLQETFVLGEMPAGEYRLSLVHYGILYEQVVTIEAGRLTFVNFFVK
ncbi:MAG: M23 family metallopeptidase [Anaerolineales bacterium]|nr:M23 family metallopeptidase [Anaerolineales bacterium]MCX7753928.1 M23 family metallopeptidase [Anaerolineales bacterium]MDW8278007.1 M23 family metallopeptidase [Anaerolineales bacterium]